MINDKFIDLHVHSNNSDGTFTPKQLLELADKNNVGMLSITDHDSISGLAGFKCNIPYGMLGVKGIEFSSFIIDNNEKIKIHILGGSIMNANNKNYSIRPLTEEERVFAEEHYSLFFYIMRNNLHLDPEEWYDILIIPYLDAVKKYHEYESARQYAFSTVLKNKLYSALTAELKQRKSKKRMPEGGIYSLDYTEQGDNPFAEYTSHALEDFWIDRKLLFEVGGKTKDFSQIKDIPNSYLAVADTEIGMGNRIPLWMFGLLY